MAGRQESHKTSTDTQLQDQQRTIPHRLLPRPLSHPQVRLVNAFLGDFDGLDQHLFKEFKTAEECWVLTYAGSSMGNSVLTWGAPNILHGTLCCIPTILHALQYRTRTTSLGPGTCHLLDCDLEQIPQSQSRSTFGQTQCRCIKWAYTSGSIL